MPQVEAHQVIRIPEVKGTAESLLGARSASGAGESLRLLGITDGAAMPVATVSAPLTFASSPEARSALH
jgi:hypothetical protein